MPRILVVEDSSAMRAFIRAALEDDGTLEGLDNQELEVVEAQSGFEALRLLPRGPWDLILSDVNMPDINGLELVNFVRKNEAHKDTPLVLVSTQASERDRERGLRLGATTYLAKPFEPEELRTLVNSLLKSVARPAGLGGG